MKILYDGEIFRMQPRGGVNRYFVNLISRLPNNLYPTLLIDHGRDCKYPSHPNLNVYHLWRTRLANFSSRLSSYLSRVENAVVRRRLARERFDVCHSTYYTLLENPATVRCPAVITVWDMIHELFAAEMDPTGQYAAEKERAIMSAQQVVCISENTKRDLMRIYNVPERKISVTYLGSEIDESMSHGPERTPERPYYLYVGSRASYKNFDGLLRAFAKAVEVEHDLALCVVGVDFTDHEKRLLSDLKLTERVEHYGHPPDSQLAKLYRRSLGFVYPSLYEGFGIPPLEAMSCGTVAIVANVASLPEVVGDAGILFDPYSEEELTNILTSLPGNEALRADLIQKGSERARNFSWEKTVAQTVEIYQSLA